VGRFNDWRKRVRRKVTGQVERTAKQFGNFKQRQFRQFTALKQRQFGQFRDQLSRQWDGFTDFKKRQFVQHRNAAKKSFIELMKYSPYITAIIAAVCAFIPVIGWIVALAIVALGALIGTYGGYYAKRYEGGTVQEGRRHGRTMRRRNYESGAIGAAVGGLAVAVVSILTAAPSAVGAAGEVSLIAGEGAAEAGFEGAVVGLSEEAVIAEVVGQSAFEAASPLTNFAAAALPTETAFVGGTIQATGGFFQNAWNWLASNYATVVTSGVALYGTAGKLLKPSQSQPAFNFSMSGGSGFGGDPGGPGPGTGGGGVDWGETAEAAVGFFDEYGVMLAIGLGIAILLAFFLG